MGMVESAMEFLRIANDESYHDIILSMKSSNTQVMVQAYRLLVKKMNDENMNYPLHLGVTEAGEGEDGRIKSAIGIGTLLDDGNTIRNRDAGQTRAVTKGATPDTADRHAVNDTRYDQPA